MKINKFLIILIAFTCLLSLVVSRNHNKFFKTQTKGSQSCQITLYDNDDNDFGKYNQNAYMSLAIDCKQSTTNATFKYLVDDLRNDLKKIKLTTGSSNCECYVQTRSSDNTLTSSITLNGNNTWSTAMYGKNIYVVMMVCKPYGNFKTECEKEKNKPYEDEKAKNAELRAKIEELKNSKNDLVDSKNEHADTIAELKVKIEGLKKLTMKKFVLLIQNTLILIK